MQLDALIKLLEAKEIGKKTQASILGETGASISRYKRDKNPSRADDQNKPGKCHYCGRAGHGTNENGRISKANREANCPAFTATCNKCSLTGQFSAVCRKRTPQKWGKADKLSSTPYSGYNEKMTTKSEDCERHRPIRVRRNVRGKYLTTLRDSRRRGSCVRRGHQREDYGHRGDGPHHQHRQPWQH